MTRAYLKEECELCTIFSSEHSCPMSNEFHHWHFHLLGEKSKHFRLLLLKDDKNKFQTGECWTPTLDSFACKQLCAPFLPTTEYVLCSWYVFKKI